MLQKACIKIVAHAIDTYLFFLIIQLSLLQNKRLLWSLFFSANVTTLMEELVLVWMTNHVNLITLSSNHCCCRVFLTGGMWGSPLQHSWKFATLWTHRSCFEKGSTGQNHSSLGSHCLMQNSYKQNCQSRLRCLAGFWIWWLYLWIT